MSTFGHLFRVHTFGESHCKAVGAIVDGCPPGLPLVEENIQHQLDRRRPGQSKLTTARQEGDKVSILSGTERGYTLGTPIGLRVRNQDMRPGDYSDMSQIPRPSHADFTYQAKYGVRASSGGGRSSARETIGRVAGGAIAEIWLKLKYNVDIVAYVSQVGAVKAPADLETRPITRADVDSTLVRCPDAALAEEMAQVIMDVRSKQDSIGGVITCVIRNAPAGLGEPCFDKLEAMLGHAMLSIPSTKGFEIGSGFSGVSMRGSEHNDPFVLKPASVPGGAARLGTLTNRSGGVQGGISNGEDIVIRIAFKPPATIGHHQDTVDFAGNKVVLEAKGRHDPCVLPRAIPIVEAMAALVIADAAMIQESRLACSIRPPITTPKEELTPEATAADEDDR